MITVLGSINVDLVTTVDKRPLVGETVIGNSFCQHAGGKGGNQAVAASKLGVDVKFLGKIGNDSQGQFVAKNMENDGVDLTNVEVADASTGVATICVDSTGANNIIVIPGANNCVDEEYIQKNSEVIKKSQAILSQFETPASATKEAFKIAKENGVTTILNPAPAQSLDKGIINLVDILVPNEFELETITGISTETDEGIDKAIDFLFDKGVKVVVVTLGSKGAYKATKEKREFFKAFKVNAVDTTAAGDSFLGGFVSSYIIDGDIDKAILKGQNVASYAVQYEGAQSSMPKTEELEEYIKNRN